MSRNLETQCDEDITLELKGDDAESVENPIPYIPAGAITRQRAKALRHKFNGYVAAALEQEVTPPKSTLHQLFNGHHGGGFRTKLNQASASDLEDFNYITLTPGKHNDMSVASPETASSLFDSNEATRPSTSSCVSVQAPWPLLSIKTRTNVYMAEEYEQAETNNAMIQMLANINTQLQTLTNRMDRMENPPVQARRNNGPEPHQNHRAYDPGDLPPPPPPRARHAYGEHEPEYQPPPPQHSPDLKLNAPTFAGRVDPEAYLEWERRMDKIFGCYNYTEAKKVAFAAAQLTDHALTWWDRDVADRRRYQDHPISTWHDMRQLMKRRYVPPHFHRELQKKFRRLTQGNKSVEEYYEEFEHLRNRLELDEAPETLMVQFLDGLQERIVTKVEMQVYHQMEDLLHLAIQAEQQIKRKNSSFSRNKNTWSSAPKQADKGKAVVIDSRFKPRAPEPSRDTKAEPRRDHQPRNQQNQQRSRDITCYKCQGRGHISRDCPNQRVMILTESGDYESQDEEEAEGDADEEITEFPDTGELLMMRRILSTMIEPEESAQRENVFHTRCTIKGKVCFLIIDGDSCTNVASLYMVEKLGLERIKHPRPYRLRWLNDKSELKITD